MFFHSKARPKRISSVRKALSNADSHIHKFRSSLSSQTSRLIKQPMNYSSAAFGLKIIIMIRIIMFIFAFYCIKMSISLRYSVITAPATVLTSPAFSHLERTVTRLTPQNPRTPNPPFSRSIIYNVITARLSALGSCSPPRVASIKF